MALAPGIQKYDIESFTNKHENFTQKLKKGASFSLKNPKGIQFPKKRDRYRQTTKNFQTLIKFAINNGSRLRAMGRGWSFTKVGVSEGGIVNTIPLNLSFALPEAYVSSDYGKTFNEAGNVIADSGNTHEDLYFLQCGTKIYEINDRLFKKNPKRSIKASGASNGQTIAGAMSTGTHGSAFKVGAIQEFVVGLHIVTGEDKHIWLERASYPVIGSKLEDWLDVTEVIRDDDLFKAALVCFGSFGFIHGVMIETEPIFLLEEHRKANVPYDDNLKKAMEHQDFSGLNFINETAEKKLYHFEILVNPHKFDDKKSFVKFSYKKAFEDHEPILRDNKFTYGDDLLGLVQTILDTLGTTISNLAIPPLVNTMFSTAFELKPPISGTIGELFNFTRFRGKAASAAIGIDAAQSDEVLEELVKVNKDLAFPGGFSLRYVKGTDATLGFTKFPNTCVLEMDGVDSEQSKKFYKKAWDTLEAKGLPFTMHWGKFNFGLNKSRVKAMYGSNLDDWIAARNALLDIPTMNVFTNKFMEQCGLDKQEGLIV